MINNFITPISFISVNCTAKRWPQAHTTTLKISGLDVLSVCVFALCVQAMNCIHLADAGPHCISNSLYQFCFLCKSSLFLHFHTIYAHRHTLNNNGNNNKQTNNQSILVFSHFSLSHIYFTASDTCHMVWCQTSDEQDCDCCVSKKLNSIKKKKKQTFIVAIYYFQALTFFFFRIFLQKFII